MAQVNYIHSEEAHRDWLCDYFFGGNSYRTEPAQMQKYYDGFVMMERLSRRGEI